MAHADRNQVRAAYNKAQRLPSNTGHSVSIDGTPNERARELGLDALKTVTIGFAWLLQEALG